MHELTVNRRDISEESIGGSGELNNADSGELLRKGSMKLARCGLPLEALLLLDDHQVRALRPSHSTGSGVVPISSHGRISGEILQLITGCGGVRERLKGGRRSNSSWWSSQAFYSKRQGRSRHIPRRRRGARGGRHAEEEEAALLLLAWAPPVSHIPKWYVAWAGCMG
jgi:hypothetical protein